MKEFWQVKEQTWRDSGQSITSVMCSAQRDGSDMEPVIIPGKISIIPPQVAPTGRG
ncbi:hypothetical protein E2C01_081963 [Portunus trituberculatus]|uniref:Uncharacterized protein n=1 Tax=Portunus trituberculatus TaxID=210409 RepID=A0A5B7IT86_PORTR|nr:hypothetical protein [Portunus trituberculatus]